MRVAGFWLVDVIREASGDVSILREVEQPESRRVEYDPPLPMLPAKLTAGEPVERASDVRLYDHESGALQATGGCKAVYTLLGTKRIDTPDGPVTAYIVKTQRRYRLPLVRVDMYLLSAYEPGRGPIAGVTRRDVWLLGLLPVSRQESVVRVR